MLLAALLFAGILTLWVPQRWALSGFQISILVLAAARIIQRLRAGASLTFSLPALLITAAPAWALLQSTAGWSIDRQRTLESALEWVVNAAAFAIALEISTDTQRRARFLRASLVFATALSVVVLFTLLTSPPGLAFWRFETGSGVPTLGPFVYKNQYASFVEAILPLAVVGAIGGRRRWVVYTLISALLFGSVIAAGSRAGAILCSAEILLIPAIAYARRDLRGKLFARTLAASIAAMALLTAIAGWEVMWNRLQEQHSYELRRDLAISSMEMIRDRPWTGFGLGTWSSAYPGYARYDDGSFVNQAHNDWLQWAAEGGAPFFAVMLAFAALMIRPAASALWGLGILAVFAHAFVDYPFQQRPALAAFFFAWMGMLWTGNSQPSLDAPDHGY